MAGCSDDLPKDRLTSRAFALAALVERPVRNRNGRIDRDIGMGDEAIIVLPVVAHGQPTPTPRRGPPTTAPTPPGRPPMPPPRPEARGRRDPLDPTTGAGRRVAGIGMAVVGFGFRVSGGGSSRFSALLTAREFPSSPAAHKTVRI